MNKQKQMNHIIEAIDHNNKDLDYLLSSTQMMMRYIDLLIYYIGKDEHISLAKRETDRGLNALYDLMEVTFKTLDNILVSQLDIEKDFKSLNQSI